MTPSLDPFTAQSALLINKQQISRCKTSVLTVTHSVNAPSGREGFKWRRFILGGSENPDLFLPFLHLQRLDMFPCRRGEQVSSVFRVPATQPRAARRPCMRRCKWREWRLIMLEKSLLPLPVFSPRSPHGMWAPSSGLLNKRAEREYVSKSHSKYLVNKKTSLPIKFKENAE